MYDFLIYFHFFSHLAIFFLSLFSCEFLGRMVHSCINCSGSGVQGSLWLLTESEVSMSYTMPCLKEQNKTTKSNIVPQHSSCSCPEFTERCVYLHLFRPLCQTPFSELSLEALDGCAGAEAKPGRVEPRLRSNRAETYRGRGHSPEG